MSHKPSNIKKPILVLDLDETLVHNDLETQTLNTRPYLRNFLRNVSLKWEIVVFTAGLRDYADTIIN
jgi:TFIIF-interacting CTD phosphatase-like protein